MNFFILVHGKLVVLINDEVKKFIYTGEGFGELALIHDTYRTATIKTVTECRL